MGKNFKKQQNNPSDYFRKGRQYRLFGIFRLRKGNLRKTGRSHSGYYKNALVQLRKVQQRTV